MGAGWIGVDLDGTLAYYDEWRGERHIGAPIEAMVERVRKWVADGVPVRIFTARVCADGGNECDVAEVRHVVEEWCRLHVGVELPVTNVKDYAMIELWDDRAVQVERNTGRRMDGADRPKPRKKTRTKA